MIEQIICKVGADLQQKRTQQRRQCGERIKHTVVDRKCRAYGHRYKGSRQGLGPRRQYPG
jgi:competence transcription factor ComK